MTRPPSEPERRDPVPESRELRAQLEAAVEKLQHYVHALNDYLEDPASGQHDGST
jgi:hypothetical protein